MYRIYLEYVQDLYIQEKLMTVLLKKNMSYNEIAEDIRMYYEGINIYLNHGLRTHLRAQSGNSSWQEFKPSDDIIYICSFENADDIYTK